SEDKFQPAKKDVEKLHPVTTARRDPFARRPDALETPRAVIDRRIRTADEPARTLSRQKIFGRKQELIIHRLKTETSWRKSNSFTTKTAWSDSAAALIF